MSPSSVHETSNSLRSSGKSGGNASCRKCETPCARLTTPMTRASRLSEPAGKARVEFTLSILLTLLLNKCFYDELADGNDLLDHGRMLDRIHVPVDRPAARAQRVARTLGPRQLHDGIVRTVRHEHRYVAIRRTRLRHDVIRADEVSRQSDQSTEALGVTHARVQRNG